MGLSKTEHRILISDILISSIQEMIPDERNSRTVQALNSDRKVGNPIWKVS